MLTLSRTLFEIPSACLESPRSPKGVKLKVTEPTLSSSYCWLQTWSSDLNFNGGLYKQLQVVGVAVGWDSHLVQYVLANIFVGFCETKTAAEQRPLFFRRFVDVTFSIFLSEYEETSFFRLLQEVRPSLGWNQEYRANYRLWTLECGELILKWSSGLSS